MARGKKGTGPYGTKNARKAAQQATRQPLPRRWVKPGPEASAQAAEGSIVERAYRKVGDLIRDELHGFDDNQRLDFFRGLAQSAQENYMQEVAKSMLRQADLRVTY